METTSADEQTGTAEAPALRPAAPSRRTPKLDPLLADAVETARAGILDAVAAQDVGNHVRGAAEADRVVTHYFESRLAGYVGWHWYAVLARVPRGKSATVSEIGLLPSADALQAPPWIPWAQRVRPEDAPEAAEAAGIRQLPVDETDAVSTDVADDVPAVTELADIGRGDDEDMD